MASIRRECRARTETFDKMMDESIKLNENNDCAVRAVAIACNRTYTEAHVMLKSLGRKSRSGTYRAQTKAAIAAFGCRITERLPAEFLVRYPGRHGLVLHNVTTHHPQRFPSAWADGKTYLLFTRGHVLAVVNGVNHDWTKGSAKRVTDIWEVTL